jgi:serine phosphatase RsbU (regulator of sigma subunit)
VGRGKGTPTQQENCKKSKESRLKKKSGVRIYLKVFLVSTIAGFGTFFIISLFFARVLSWKLVAESAIFGPIIGNMIGFASALIGDPISRRLESLPKPFSTISQALIFFVVALGAATLFFFLMVKLEIMRGLSTKLLLIFLLIAAGIGLVVTLIMTVYEHLKSELEKSYEKIREKELLERELQVASQVQTGFLPKAEVQIEGFDVATFFRSAREVGGDYFDVILLKKGVAIVIADVSGKGVPAALVTANLHATLHALAEECPPGKLVSRINNSIFKDTSPDFFVTFFYGVLNNSTGEFKYVNAGHNPPLVVRQDGMVEELTQGGTILGILPDSVFQTGSTVLNPQEFLLLYTDGLTEAGLPEIEPWGEENLKRYLVGIHDNPADRMSELILKQVEESLKGAAQTDDIP